jgi:putative phage-type endonuclease
MPPIMLCDHQRSAQWLMARIGRMTASVAPAALGLSPYKSPKAAWREITGQRTEAEANEYQNNRALEWGVQFEAKARLHYEAATGNEVRETGLWGSGEHIWLAASPDGLIGTDGMVEIKAPEYCCTALPEHYRVQCQVQAIVLERQWVDFYSYGWRDERAYLDRVPRPSAEEEAALIGALANWWVTYVFHRTEPPRRKPARKQPEPIACPF